jgi:hypothetical protein
MDTTYSYLGPTLFPSREDMTSAPRYNEWNDKDVDHVDGIVDRLWEDPPATPFDKSATYGPDDYTQDDEDEDWANAILRMFGL